MPSPSHVLRMESLERRDTPSTATPTTINPPWADANALTLSFAPDATPVGDGLSTLNQLMQKAGRSAEWKEEILRAFQTWAVQTNANVAVVADSGDAFGTAGDRQGDNRFGDIRVGAAALSTDSLANAVPNDPAVGTWSGDVVFNTLKRFAVNPATATAGYDLFTAALHEAGHVFGLDHSDDPASAMTERYTGVKGGLTAADVAGVQSVYGVRQADAYEGAGGNDTFATATALSPELYQVITADLTAAGDADVFAFTVPAGSKKGTVTLRTAGVSSVAAGIEVFDAAGQLVSRSDPADPLRPKDVKITLPDARADTRYFARVASPNTDVFAVGRYVLTFNLDEVKANGSAASLKDGGTNDTLATADLMPALSNGSNHRFRVNATLEGKADVDAYRLTAPVVPTADALQIEVRNLKGDRVAPAVRVFDAAGNPLVVQVLESGPSKTTLQVLGISRGETYFVTARSPDGQDASGDYRLNADFTAPVVRGLTQLDSGVLSPYVTEAEGTLVLGSARLVQLSLNVASPDPTAAVKLQVLDARGRVVGEWEVNTLTGQANGSVLLEAGTYTVAVAVRAKKGQTPPTVRYWLFGAVSSDPIGPTAPTTGTLPTSPPPPPPPPPFTYVGTAQPVPVGYGYKS